MRIVVVGAGLMGSQIGCEYALCGHEVVLVGRRPEATRERVERTLGLVVELGLHDAATIDGARLRIDITSRIDGIGGAVDLVVESIVEDMGAKIAVLAPAARRWPGAIVASNTSSLSITELGEGIGAPERTIGTHYWNPPLLMPLVEVIRGEGTEQGVVERVTETLRGLGKRPVAVERDVPGFVWNRMQLALLREAVWIVEQGVATPETVDAIVRDGLARRWRYTGPFQTAALGGAATFERIAANLFPVLSRADRLFDLQRWLDQPAKALEGARAARDRGLLEDLRRERAGATVDEPLPAAGETAPW